MFGTFAQAGLITLAPATSQARGGAQTPVARIPEQRVQVDQVPEVIPVQPVAPVQPEVRATTSEVEQLRLERYKKYHPPTFSILASKDAHDFLEECYRIVRTMGILESSGVAFTTFHLKGATYQWWRAYGLGSLAKAASLTWDQFSETFLREFVPERLRDAWRIEFEQLRQALVATVREQTRRLIEGLNLGIRFSMARELEMDIPYQQVVEIARILEGMWAWEREKRKAKRPRDSGTYSGARALVVAVACHARGYVSRPIHSALLASSSIPATPRPQVPHYAPPLSSAPPARGAFFDSTYSYVSSYFAPYLGVFCDSFSSPIYVSTPVVDSIVVGRMYRSCLVVLGGFEIRVDLLLLNMVDFDIILGMDWLLPFHAILNCHAKTVTLAMPGFPRLEWMGALAYVPSRAISFLKAQWMVQKGCNMYLAYVRDVSVNTPIVESVPIVKDYPDVFPADLPGMPPNRDIDFGIDLLSGTQPISIPPYRMAPAKLKE
ncbi:uncharacterized protein [Nicotiana tomentosiformis]|uniref:uncharacterized protein n=1 Tax=Nicotiana tomentosiformis TaxID=4098 RepID=UPI00388C5849